MKNNKQIVSQEITATFKSDTGEILGYELRNIENLNIEYIYADELETRNIVEKTVGTKELKINKQPEEKASRLIDKLISKFKVSEKELVTQEVSRIDRLLGTDTNDQVARYNKTKIFQLEKAIERELSSDKHYILKEKFETTERCGKTLHIPFRGTAFYNISPIKFLDFRGIELGTLYVTFEIDYNTAIVLYQPAAKKKKQKVGLLYRGEIEYAIEFIGDIITIDKKSATNSETGDGSKYKENTLQIEEERKYIIQCIRKEDAENTEIYTPHGELVHREKK